MLKWCVLGATLIASSAFGQVYKCKDGSGKQIFSDMPCGAGAQTVNVKPPRGETPDGWRDDAWERQLNDLKQRERAEAASEQRARKLRDADREREALAAERKSRRCNELKAERDAAEAVMRNGATQWQYEDARARGSAVQKQIAREC